MIFGVAVFWVNSFDIAKWLFDQFLYVVFFLRVFEFSL